MRNILNDSIEKARELPESDQDIAATEILGLLGDFPTVSEREAINEGRRQIERGEFVTLDQLKHEMGADRR